MVNELQLQKISNLLSSQKRLEFPEEWGFCKTKIFKENVWRIPRGGGGVRGMGGMDIFWNYTIEGLG